MGHHKGVPTKRLIVLLLALMVIACQTLFQEPIKTCKQAILDFTAAQRAEGRVLFEQQTDELGGYGFVFWDHISPTVAMEFVAPPGYPVAPEFNLTHVEACSVGTETEGAVVSTWQHYQKTIPINF